MCDAPASGRPSRRCPRSLCGRIGGVTNIDWRKHLAPFYGKTCDIKWESGRGAAHRLNDHEVYLFDAEKEPDRVEELVTGIIGDWDVLREELGKGEEELVMFATESDEDEDEGTSMVEMIFFYDRNTGETYYYEEGSFYVLNAGPKLSPLRLDQITIAATKE
jgi:hypothetical protein